MSPILLNFLIRLPLYLPYLDSFHQAQQVIQFAWNNVLPMLGTVFSMVTYRKLTTTLAVISLDPEVVCKG